MQTTKMSTSLERKQWRHTPVPAYVRVMALHLPSSSKQIYHASGDTTWILSEAISISRRPRHRSPPEAKLVVKKSGLWSNLSVHSEYVSVYQNSLH